jgi:hypothetical protein
MLKSDRYTGGGVGFCRHCVRFGFFAAVFILSSLSALSAQTSREVRSVIKNAAGRNFVVMNGGTMVELGYSDIPEFGLGLKQNDTVETPTGAFMSSLLVPSNAALCVAENSSVVFAKQPNYNYDPTYSYSTGSLSSFVLQYGRVRVATQNASQNSVTVQAGNSLVIINSGDVNVDYTTPVASYIGNLELSLYVFSGSATVIPDIALPSQNRLTVRPGETITFVGNGNTVDRRFSDGGLVGYWASVPIGVGDILGHTLTRYATYPPQIAQSDPAVNYYGSHQNTFLTPGKEVGYVDNYAPRRQSTVVRITEPGMELGFTSDPSISYYQARQYEVPVPARSPVNTVYDATGVAAFTVSTESKTGGAKLATAIVGTTLTALGLGVAAFTYFAGEQYISQDTAMLKNIMLFGGFVPAGVGIGFLVVSLFL